MPLVVFSAVVLYFLFARFVTMPVVACAVMVLYAHVARRTSQQVHPRDRARRGPLCHMGCSDVAMALEKGRSPLRLPAESSGPNVDSSDRRSRFHECATAEALLSLEPRAAFGPSGLCTCSFRTRSCSAAITPTPRTCLALLPAPSSAGLSGIAPLVGLFWGVNPASSRKSRNSFGVW